MRLICAGVNIGNICSTRELVRGSPPGVLLITVLSSAVAPQKLLDLFKMHLWNHASQILLFDLTSLYAAALNCGLNQKYGCKGRSYRERYYT
ncbi:MAG TPA: hypothetical protein VEH06_09760 [Candidatus Bathyarchaeia archaeon]|nr:hypothetical protein [Candidatus Bathyarchaeia archaeon]